MVPSAARWYEASVAGSRSATSEPSRMRSERESRERSHAARRAAGEGDGFNCVLYQKEKHGRRKCCIQGGKARDFVEFFLEPNVLLAASIGY